MPRTGNRTIGSGGGGRLVEADPLRDPRAPAYAHVLARTSFGPFPGQLATALGTYATVDALVDAQLRGAPIPFVPTAVVDGVTEPVDIDAIGVPDPPDLATNRRAIQLYNAFRPWWLARMQSDDAGLHEKMMWFWHGHFTTASDKVDNNSLNWRNLRTLHRHALGNFRELTKAITVDGAMLRYLDGSDSRYPEPNENYARELMELFTIGRGPYTQRDIVAAANALSGWFVDLTTQEVSFRPEYSLDRPVRFLGKRARFDADGIVDRVVDRPECAPFIVRKLWKAFVSPDPDPDVVAEWADGFRASDYEIAPLMATILRSEAFAGSRGLRNRSPVEWYSAVVRATEEVDHDAKVHTALLGQTPYVPPNVSGWPGDAAWASPAQSQARASILTRLRFPVAARLAGETDLVDAIAHQCSITGLSDTTRGALTELDGRLRSDAGSPPAVRAGAVLAAACLSPEMAVS